MRGRLAAAEVAEARSRSGVFLMTSHAGYEGFPRVLVEAMAAGLPAVVTQGADTGGLVQQGVSGFVCGRDPAELADAITAARPWTGQRSPPPSPRSALRAWSARSSSRTGPNRRSSTPAERAGDRPVVGIADRLLANILILACLRSERDGKSAAESGETDIAASFFRVDLSGDGPLCTLRAYQADERFPFGRMGDTRDGQPRRPRHDRIAGGRRVRMAHRRPMTLVLGARAIEVVRSLAMEGIPVGVVAPNGDPAHWSRYARSLMRWDWMLPGDQHDEALAERLVEFGRRQPVPPVLMYCSDQSMVFVSRHRERLAQGFRFVVPQAWLVEATEDRAQFAALAAERFLPVPPTVVLDHCLLEPPGELLDLGLPIIVKPTARDHTWVAAVGSSTKALRIETKEQLLEFWPRLRGLSKQAVAQPSIPGPETALVSHHLYIDEKGEVAGEFTGRKIRTIPAEYGHTSALTITDDPEVVRLGRAVCRAVDLRGVAKLDFKYSPDGRLYLLKINARLTLWAHAGARAGVNLPAIMYADLVGKPRPERAKNHACLNWVHPKDVLAARAQGISISEWLMWLWRTRPVMAVWRWDDPLPLLAMLAARVKSAGRGSSATDID